MPLPNDIKSWGMDDPTLRNVWIGLTATGLRNLCQFPDMSSLVWCRFTCGIRLAEVTDEVSRSFNDKDHSSRMRSVGALRLRDGEASQFVKIKNAWSFGNEMNGMIAVRFGVDRFRTSLLDSCYR